MPINFHDSYLVAATCDLLTEQANQQISGNVAFYPDCAQGFGDPILELGVGIDRSKTLLDAAG
ncbi:MAG: hypothetical protein AAFO01_19205 [Pseudomonadota bacterium]